MKFNNELCRAHRYYNDERTMSKLYFLHYNYLSSCGDMTSDPNIYWKSNFCATTAKQNVLRHHIWFSKTTKLC